MLVHACLLFMTHEKIYSFHVWSFAKVMTFDCILIRLQTCGQNSKFYCKCLHLKVVAWKHRCHSYESWLTSHEQTMNNCRECTLLARVALFHYLNLNFSFFNFKGCSPPPPKLTCTLHPSLYKILALSNINFVRSK